MDSLITDNFRERFEELKDEYARRHGFYGEDDEFISTWWENDEDLYDAESYAYDIILKETKERQKEESDNIIVDPSSLEEQILAANKQKNDKDVSSVELDIER